MPFKIRRNKFDILMSNLVRARDNWTCQKCGKYLYENKGSAHNSHYIPRRYINVRWDLENCDCLCFSCHVGSTQFTHSEYVDFKKNQLGDKKHDELIERGKIIVKRKLIETPELYRNLKEMLKSYEF